MGAFGRLFRKKRVTMAELLDHLEAFEDEAREIAQPKGQIRTCTLDGDELQVVMMVGADEREGGGVMYYMVCDRCGSKYVEQVELRG